MKLLSRYVVREHVGPLLFSLSALTSLLMLQYVARQLANLAGKGLPWSAVAEFFVLSLPFTIEMTLPMAVLVATLYAFGRMAAEHEITAFKASGIRVRRIVAPVLMCAFLLSMVMVWFNDQVVSFANHRLRVLQQNIARTRPTLALRDQTLNAITDAFYIRVARTDARTNSMYDVTIYDMTGGAARKTIYADSGVFGVSANGQDLQMRLFDGNVQEFVRGDPRRFQRTAFRTQIVRLRDIMRGFQSSGGDTYRGDREMSVCEMQRKYVASAVDFERLRQEYITHASRLAKPGQKTIKAPRGRAREIRIAQLYCGAFDRLLPRTAVAQGAPIASSVPLYTTDADSEQARPAAMHSPRTQLGLSWVQPVGGVSASQEGQQPPPQQQAPPQQPAQQQPPPQQPPVPPPVPAPVPVPVPGGQTIPPVPGTATGGLPPAVVPGQAVPGQPVAGQPIPAPASAPVPGPIVDSTQSFQDAVSALTTQLTVARETVDSLNVEIQKKFALAVACFVFVLFGPPIALRFPRGGVGVTLGVSIVVFGMYYCALMAGEALADKGKLPPSIAMWIANLVFAIVGVALLWRVENTTDTSRGGGIRDWWTNRKSMRALQRELAAKTRPPRVDLAASGSREPADAAA